jgi:hypothetical protein
VLTGRRRIVVGAVLALVVLGLLAIGRSRNLDGTFTIVDPDGYREVATGCRGIGGDADITPGTGIVLRDDTGRVVARSTLGDGSEDAAGCTFPFTLYAVPHSEAYELQVGSRGSLTYAREELDRLDWTVELSSGL